MNKNCQFIFVVLTVILMSVSVIGCGSVKEKQIIPRTLTLYNAGTNPGERELWDQAKREFESSHPGVTVNYVSYTGGMYTTSSYLSQLDDLMKSNNPADIVMGNSTLFSILENRGNLYDLSPLASTSNINLEDYFYKPLLDYYTDQQRQMAIPLSINPMIVLYNRTVFQNAGVSDPNQNWTWDDFVETAKKIQFQSGQKNSTATVFPLSPFGLSTLSLQKGGSFLSPDGSTFSGYLDGKSSVDAVTWYADHLKEGLFDSHYSANTMMQLQTGSVDMYVTFYSSISSISQENLDKIGIATVPSFNDGVQAVYGTSGGLALLQKSKNPDLAWDFIKYFSMDKNDFTEAMLKNYDENISKKVMSIMEQDPYYGVKLKSASFIKKDLQENNASYPDIQVNFAKGLEDIVMNATDIQKELSALADSSNNELAQTATNNDAGTPPNP